jgi:hypothetical protein
MLRRGRLRRDLGLLYAANDLIGFIFSATGPVAVILAVGTAGGLSPDRRGLLAELRGQLRAGADAQGSPWTLAREAMKVCDPALPRCAARRCRYTFPDRS